MALGRLFGKDTPGHEILRVFDLAAGTSTGSLVLAGLLENMTPAKIQNLFLDERTRRNFFAPTQNLFYRLLSFLGFIPRYQEKGKARAIRELLPGLKTRILAEAAALVPRPNSKAPLHLLVIAFDYDRNVAAFFRSKVTRSPGWGSGGESDFSVAEVVDASTTAPVAYFDAPSQLYLEKRCMRFWDGAMGGYNNPVLAAVTEAIVLGANPQEIVALSLGTRRVALPPAPAGETRSPLFRNPTPSGLLQDARKAATVILDDPPDSATFLAHVLTGGSQGLWSETDSRIIRMCPMISPVLTPDGIWKPPGNLDEKEFSILAQMRMDELAPAHLQRMVNYASLWMEDLVPNQPVRMDYDKLECEIGYSSFHAAWDAWKKAISEPPAIFRGPSFS